MRTKDSSSNACRNVPRVRYPVYGHWVQGKGRGDIERGERAAGLGLGHGTNAEANLKRGLGLVK